MLRRAVSHLARATKHTGACACPGCLARALPSLAACTPARPALSVASRSFHSCSWRAAAAKGGNDGGFADLDDLFGEEQALSGAGSGASSSGASSGSSASSTSRLGSLLSSTLRASAESAGRNVLASAASQEATAAVLAAELLSKANPPKLEKRHFDLLRRALKDLRAKKARAMASARDASTEASNATVALLTQQEAILSRVCGALFPPESVFDDERTSDMVDLAESMPGVLRVLTPDSLDPMRALGAAKSKTTREQRHQFCLFCKPTTAMLPHNEMVYTNLNLLTQFLNERGMIIAREESRLCAKHQRKLARTVKQARNIGLLSPMSNWRVDHEFVYGPQAASFNPHASAELTRGGRAMQQMAAASAAAYEFDAGSEAAFDDHFQALDKDQAFNQQDDGGFDDDFGSKQ